MSSAFIAFLPTSIEKEQVMQFESISSQLNNEISLKISSRENLRTQISGVSSTFSLAEYFCATNQANTLQSPQLIVFPGSEQLDEFVRNIEFFIPDAQYHILDGFDVSPYSGLYPNRIHLCKRIGWLWRALNAKPGEIFLASIESAMQMTFPVEVLIDNAIHLSINDDLPNDFLRRLNKLGYHQVTQVEDPGQYALRGGLIDVFSPAHSDPVRIELFGDIIEAARFFDADTQRTVEKTESFTIVPARECLYTDETRSKASQCFSDALKSVDSIDQDYSQNLQKLTRGEYFNGLDFLLPYFYEEPTSPIQFFQDGVSLWLYDWMECYRKSDQVFSNYKELYEASRPHQVLVNPLLLYQNADQLLESAEKDLFIVSRLDIDEKKFEHFEKIQVKAQIINKNQFENAEGSREEAASAKITQWQQDGYRVVISTRTETQATRIKAILDHHSLSAKIVSRDEALWQTWGHELVIIPRGTSHSLRIEDDFLIVLREEELLGKSKRHVKAAKRVQEQTAAFSLQDLDPGSLIVHSEHGVGVYEGLKSMAIAGGESEFLQISYKDGDRLYVPIYRISQIQRFTGSSPLDKLGNNRWEKTKAKVKSKLKDIASELLSLYAHRSQIKREPFSPPDENFQKFESLFPYDETPDQLTALADIIEDMTSEKPMDRLICGDVGFGKTEIALRAAFKCVLDKKQVAIVAPTTILALQHYQTLKKRFAKWPINYASLSRLTSSKQSKETVKRISEGDVDIVVGTHRLFSKDIQFANLGLLIIDEEQRFGVTHKERLRRLKHSVDTMTLTATPIPRTLNMSLVGIRDLSLINTPPPDRLAVRTFVCKFDMSTIRKAIESEISRGGQVFFVHNRVQSIYNLSQQLQEAMPKVRFRVAHGQMKETELEETMVGFFSHDFDVLLCTSIIESGMDIPSANTIIIDKADNLGLSQLYQLRGRVGRSKERAYCYLLIPKEGISDPIAQERIKAIQENSDLGSGIRIAHHDLELRGAGNILGAEQSGHINAVGYELYTELLQQVLQELKGEEVVPEVEPEINVKFPALIPNEYIPEIKLRLAYYRKLSMITNESDIDEMEDELRDLFGKPPEPVFNLLGLMLIRHYCKKLHVSDLSAGAKSITLTFSETTPLDSKSVIELTTQNNKKYTIQPNSRLSIRMNDLSWPKIYDEIRFLNRLSG
jgi:transcription-repair coupling factor (superfamily II helicase)